MAVQAGAADVNKKALNYAEEHVDAAFKFAQELVKAQNVEDMMKLQQDYLRRPDGIPRRTGARVFQLGNEGRSGRGQGHPEKIIRPAFFLAQGTRAPRKVPQVFH